jgi:hypothetical protein
MPVAASLAKPGVLSGCQHCQYRIKSQEEAADLLQNVIRQAHMQEIAGGGLLLEAKLDPGVVLKLCLWESHCADCEEHEDFGDSTEPDSQGAVQ